jgi:hypothetical protein
MQGCGGKQTTKSQIARVADWWLQGGARNTNTASEDLSQQPDFQRGASARVHSRGSSARFGSANSPVPVTNHNPALQQLRAARNKNPE